MPSIRARRLRSRYLSISRSGGSILLSFTPDENLTMGSAARAKAARSRVIATLKGVAHKIQSNGVERLIVSIEPANLEEAKRLIAAIDKALSLFVNERLTPRMVEEILGITSRERIRWNKDGRLPKSGTGSFRKGRQEIHFYLHPVDKIAALAAAPEIIASWRRADT